MNAGKTDFAPNRRRGLLLLAASMMTAPLRGQTTVPPINAEQSDFAQLRHYQAANTSVKGARVVFLGDSITEYWGWHSGKWFANAGWLNRGIGGQTTQQLLLRERADALALEPKAIVLEGASNDMRLGFSPPAIRDNLESMGELAQAHGVKVFVAGMTPVCNCVRPLTGLRTVERIGELNGLIRKMCLEKGWIYVDLNTPLADASGLMRSELTVDGVHPNDEGYRLLAPVILRALHDYL